MSKDSICSIFILILMISFNIRAQTTFDLYAGKIPNSKPSPNEEKTEVHDGITIVSKITHPTLTVFLPAKEKANGTAVIVVPGGGYWINASGHEGIDVAKKLNEVGVTAFVLKYRIPNDATMENKEIGSLQDAQQAIKVVRQRAGEWNIKPDRIGIMGFSAGGHLASTAGTHYSKAVINNEEKINLRPDFMILIYPVISFQENITHMGSRDQLIGKNPSKEKIDLYSNELQITKDTPPTFLVHATNDDVVKVENSIRFYDHLIQNSVPAEMHIYQKGGHGFGMKNPTSSDLWMERLQNWMQSNGWL
jgi:acetyl esterase/lipase